MKMQDYLRPNEINSQEAKFIFHLRSRMVDVRANLSERYSDLLCPLCHREEDTQKHLLECPNLDDGSVLVTKVPSYSDIFSENLQSKIEVARIILAKFTKRKEVLRK